MRYHLRSPSSYRTWCFPSEARYSVVFPEKRSPSDHKMVTRRPTNASGSSSQNRAGAAAGGKVGASLPSSPSSCASSGVSAGRGGAGGASRDSKDSAVASGSAAAAAAATVRPDPERSNTAAPSESSARKRSRKALPLRAARLPWVSPAKSPPSSTVPWSHARRCPATSRDTSSWCVIPAAPLPLGPPTSAASSDKAFETASVSAPPPPPPFVQRASVATMASAAVAVGNRGEASPTRESNREGSERLFVKLLLPSSPSSRSSTAFARTFRTPNR
mmetsp:Transcript_27668/g.55753  ORF Transcript_27668/g.55753 Transcript_27668/m.55753 type:complete len:275 (+) Transcript_27668:695-1519(+)